MSLKAVPAQEAGRYFGKALDWEADRVARIERSERRAWLVAFVMCVLAAILVVAIIALMPLKRVVPYVYAVDKQTGEMSLMDAAGQRQIAANQDLLDKHWAQSYVIARESYDWKLLQTDFDSTVAFSAPQIAQGYAARFQGAQAINKVWGANVERDVSVTSIQLAPDSVGKKAVVRYTVQQKDLQSGALQPLEHYIATIAYEYHPERSGKEQDLIRNPLGFTVTAFRADPEIGGVAAVAPGSEAQP
ncbi:MAG TPA: type IV secretion system protein [Asticcacaulis sp.]|nr:type IV secretion system protein [Asticcacaulis sp.]